MEEAHIYIYGDIGSWQSKDSSDWGEITLANVRKQYEAQKDVDSITLHIHSPGGYVAEGFAIHDYIRSLGKPVTTIIEGMCYSIATVIALAGDTRMMTSNADFMIHNPWGSTWGDSEEFQKYADDLKKIEDKIANFYASKTNITADEAKQLMKEETFMDAEKALERGFITEISAVMKAVAKFNYKNNVKMPDEKMTKKEAESALDRALKTIKAVFTGQETKNKIVQDASGTEIDFPDLAEDQTPSVGDSATVDKVAAKGDYLMANGETYVFENGKLTEIKEAEEEEESEEMNLLRNEVKNLKEQLKKEKDAAKNLKGDNEKLTKDLKKQSDALKDVEEQIKNIKKEIGSGFTYDPGERNYKKDEGEPQVRPLFKAN